MVENPLEPDVLFRSFVLVCFFCSLLQGQVSFGDANRLVDHITAPRAVKSADLDQDGDLDVIGFSDWGPQVAWWFNDGSGNFSSGGEWISESGLDHVLAVEDFDNDGVIDILLAKANKPEVLLIRGKLEMEFGAPEAVPIDLDDEWSGWNSLRALDVNFDGLTDLLLNGMLYFQTEGLEFSNSGISVPSDEENLLFADLDGNGFLDFLHEVESSSFLVTMVFSDRSETQTFFPDTDGRTLREIAPLTRVNPNDPVPLFLIFERSDFEGDPVIQEEERRVAIIGENGQLEEVWSEVVSSSELLTFRYEAFCDLNSGRLFLSASGYFPENIPSQFYRTFEARWESGQLNLAELDGATGILQLAGPSLGDLNGDGILDLLLPFSFLSGIITNAVDEIVWLEGVGSTTFGGEAHAVGSRGLGTDVQYVGDIDGDGDVDFLVNASPLLGLEAALVLWENLGDGLRFEQREIECPDGFSYQIVSAEDLMGVLDGASSIDGVDVDWPAGRMDFLVAATRSQFEDRWNSSQELLMFRLLQNSSGEFLVEEVAIPFRLRNTFGLPYYLPWLNSVSQLDWDRDGHQDLVLNLSDADPSVWWMKGDGWGFSDPQELVTNVGFPQVLDWDQDGFPDVLGYELEDYFFIDYSLFRNDGSGGLLEGVPSTANLIDLGVDLNGDGLSDFATTEWVGRYANTGESFDLGPAPFGFQGTYFDLDEDGDLDLIRSEASCGVSGYQSLYWFENRGQEQAPPPWPFESNGWLPVSYQGIAAPRLAGRNQFFHVDMNGDGQRDLLVSSSNFNAHLEWFEIDLEELPPRYLEWISSHEAMGHSAGIYEDYDEDTWTNVEEFAFGTDPSVRDAESTNLPQIRLGMAGPEFSFLIRLDADEQGLVREDFRSPNLVDWFLYEGQLRREPEGEDYERVTLPASEFSREFFRTRITLEADE